VALEQLRPSRPSRRADQVHQTRLFGRLGLAAQQADRRQGRRRIMALSDKRSTIHHDDVEPKVFFMDIKCAAHSRRQPIAASTRDAPPNPWGRRMHGIAARLRFLSKNASAGASAPIFAFPANQLISLGWEIGHFTKTLIESMFLIRTLLI
jgi:hypothetical protein